MKRPRSLQFTDSHVGSGRPCVTYRDLPDDAMLVYELTLVDLPGKWVPEMERRLTDRAIAAPQIQDPG